MLDATNQYPLETLFLHCGGCEWRWRKQDEEGIWGCVLSCRCKGLGDLWMERARKDKDLRRKNSSLSVPNGTLKEIFTARNSGN